MARLQEFLLLPELPHQDRTTPTSLQKGDLVVSIVDGEFAYTKSSLDSFTKKQKAPKGKAGIFRSGSSFLSRRPATLDTKPSFLNPLALQQVVAGDKAAAPVPIPQGSVLRKISLKVKMGELVTIIGPVGR